MSRIAVRSGVTPHDFLAWERAESERHEYFAGEIFAMAGGTPRHAALAARVARALARELAGLAGCEVFSADLRVGLAADHYVYADVSVVCGPTELQAGTPDVVQNPGVVAEVLSSSTEQYDRGLKWDGYRRLPSLRDYLLVSQVSPRIEHFSRGADGAWTYRVAEAGGRVTLAGGGQLEVDEIFAGVFAVPGE